MYISKYASRGDFHPVKTRWLALICLYNHPPFPSSSSSLLFHSYSCQKFRTSTQVLLSATASPGSTQEVDHMDPQSQPNHLTMTPEDSPIPSEEAASAAGLPTPETSVDQQPITDQSSVLQSSRKRRSEGDERPRKYRRAKKTSQSTSGGFPNTRSQDKAEDLEESTKNLEPMHDIQPSLTQRIMDFAAEQNVTSEADFVAFVRELADIGSEIARSTISQAHYPPPVAGFTDSGDPRGNLDKVQARRPEPGETSVDSVSQTSDNMDTTEDGQVCTDEADVSNQDHL